MELINTNLKHLLVVSFISLFFVNCKKEKEAYEGSLLKRTRVVEANQIVTIDSFLYDSQKRLTGIKYVNNTGYDKTIIYDQQGRLAKVISSFMGVDKYTSFFEYNSKGQIIKKTTAPETGYYYASNESYAYDNAGRLIADTTFLRQTDTVQYYNTFKYNERGNIIESDFRNFIDPGNQGTTSYTFDEHPNPYNKQGAIYFFVTGNPDYLNSNNTIETISWWFNSIATLFEYQKNGLPKQFLTAGRAGGSSIYETTYLLEYW